MINISIKDLAHYQKAFSEAIKFPMSMRTAEMMEKFLKETDEKVKKAMEEFKFEEKKQALIKKAADELDAKFKNAVDKNEVDASDAEAVRKFKENLQKELESTWASKEEKDLIDEFYSITLMVEPVDYVLDEKLPWIFNISMRDDKSGLINYKKK